MYFILKLTVKSLIRVMEKSKFILSVSGCHFKVVMKKTKVNLHTILHLKTPEAA